MSDTEQIELERATVMKLRRQKAILDNQQSECPDLTIDSYINYLLDTEEAARNGYYDTDTDRSGGGSDAE